MIVGRTLSSSAPDETGGFWPRNPAQILAASNGGWADGAATRPPATVNGSKEGMTTFEALTLGCEGAVGCLS